MLLTDNDHVPPTALYSLVVRTVITWFVFLSLISTTPTWQARDLRNVSAIIGEICGPVVSSTLRYSKYN